MSKQLPNKQRKTILILCLVGVGMFGFAFAMVPLYQLICNSLGINNLDNTGARMAMADNKVIIDESREITIQFDVTINSNAKVTFVPQHKKITLHPGETFKTNYIITNLLNREMVTQSIPSVTPWQATKYLKKIECFCFTQQTLKANETKEMGLVFYIDPELPKEYTTLTLSYTLMDTNPDKAP